MINFDEVTKGDIKEYNTNWPENPDHPYGISKLDVKKTCSTIHWINHLNLEQKIGSK